MEAFHKALHMARTGMAEHSLDDESSVFDSEKKSHSQKRQTYDAQIQNFIQPCLIAHSTNQTREKDKLRCPGGMDLDIPVPRTM